MGLLDLLEFALKCFDVLAWPLFALVYPLYSSIRAIEKNSISDTLKLNTYWVVFSLILLFEYDFMKLLEWFPLWLHIRLLIVFWLVIPHFDGAFYVYKHLICPCLSMDLQNVITWFNNRKESLMRENFLSEVERYVKENGPEALENIVTGKLTESNIDLKEFNAISMDNKAVSQVEPNLTGTEDRFSAMKINEKAIEFAEDKEILETPPPKKVQIGEWTCTVSPLPTQTDTTFNSPPGVSKHKAEYEALKLKNETEPKLTQTESSTFAAMETKEKPVEVATGREDLEFPPENVQKEWTCALCQVTTPCKQSLNSHLKGSKHKAAYDALKARNQAFLPKMAPASTTRTSDQPNTEPVKSTPSSESKIKVNINENVGGQKNSSPALEELAEGVSSNVQKGKISVNVEEKIQSQQEKPNEVRMMKSSLVWCKLCGVRCPSEIAMLYHLNGKKHKKNVQEQQENPNKKPVKSTPSSESKLKVDINENVRGQKNSSPAKLHKLKETVQEQQVARRNKRGRNHRGRLSPDIGEPVAMWHNGWDSAPAQPVVMWHNGWDSAPAQPVAMWHNGWDSAPAQPVAAPEYIADYSFGLGGDQWPAQITDASWSTDVVAPAGGAIPVAAGTGWTRGPVAVWQDGWDSAPAPPVAAPYLRGWCSRSPQWLGLRKFW